MDVCVSVCIIEKKIETKINREKDSEKREMRMQTRSTEMRTGKQIYFLDQSKDHESQRNVEEPECE